MTVDRWMMGPMEQSGSSPPLPLSPIKVCSAIANQTKPTRSRFHTAMRARTAATYDAAVGRADGRVDGGTEVRERFETEALYLMKSCSLNGWIFH